MSYRSNNQFRVREFNDYPQPYLSFASERRPLNDTKTFLSQSGYSINTVKDDTSQIAPDQQSETCVENEKSGTYTQSLLNEMRKQRKYEKPHPQSIAVNVKSKSHEYDELASPIMREEAHVTHINSTDDMDDTMLNAENTVTITRKITRRQKAAQKIVTLRDSYIEQISSPLPTVDFLSETDDDEMDITLTQEYKTLSEVVSPQRVLSNESAPTVFEPIRSVVEEEIVVPIRNVAVKTSLPYEKLKIFNENENETFDEPEMDLTNIEPYETVSEMVNLQRAVSDESVTTVFEPILPIVEEEIVVPLRHVAVKTSLPYENLDKFKVNENETIEHNAGETFTTEGQYATVSGYSARKENLKSQQIQEERNTVFKNAQLERNIGRRSEMTEEIETITLQPIGKGVQNLALLHSETLSRPISRATTPKGVNGTFTNSYFREDKKQVGNYSTLPSMPKLVKTNSVRNVVQSSKYDLAEVYRQSAPRTMKEQFYQTTHNTAGNEYAFIASPKRDVNGLTTNTSWKIKNEAYSGGNRSYQSPMSPTYNRDSIYSNITMSTLEDQRINLQMVMNTESLWYQPSCSKDDVIIYLKSKPAGNFIIRSSSTFADAYGLALKVFALPQNAVNTHDPQSDLVRHFLIESVEDSSGNGVRLKGIDNEQIYPSLSHLVHAHCQHNIGLPIRLSLPHVSFGRMNSADGIVARSQYHYETQQDQQQMASIGVRNFAQIQRSVSTPGVNFSAINHPNPLHQNFVVRAMYLGKVEVDKLSGDTAVERAVDKIMSKNSQKASPVEVVLDSTKGITINDKIEKLFHTRQFPVQHVQHAGFDPKHRVYSSTLLHKTGINSGRIMGIVVKKQKMILRENAVHLFCEIDDSNHIGDVIMFINEIYLNMDT